MAFEYYCTYCGKKLDSQNVLFNMEPIFPAASDDKWRILKLRITESELRMLFDAGRPTEKGYHACSWTYNDVISIIANENNLNREIIKTLTLEDIDKYDGRIEFNHEEKVKESKLNLFEVESEDEDEQEIELEEIASLPAAIEELEKMNLKIQNEAFTQDDVKKDLRKLRSVFNYSDKIDFEIQPDFEKDTNGDEVLTGYRIRVAQREAQIKAARVCPKCGESVFSHAGTAKHQLIVFIGSQMSGKTSTILSLAHYARAGILETLHPIWNNTKTIPSVASIELLSPSDRLLEDLKLYERGIAPAKTNATQRDDAYSATMLVRNKIEDKKYILTFTDLPGELCLNDGTIDKDKVLNDFSAALSCDAFVACFDTTNIANDVEYVNNVCHWTDEFQRDRAWNNASKSYIPTLVLFTKCNDLENGTEGMLKFKAYNDPIEDLYVFREERRRIEESGDKRYQFVCTSFNEVGNLKNGYCAMLRCSPYGHPSPTKENAEKSEDPIALPNPLKIKELMTWLLMVCGCIPVKICYKAYEDAPEYTLDTYCLSRGQHRDEIPKDNDNEAFARCMLFRNPGIFDVGFVETHGDKARRLILKLKSKAKRASNSERD